MVEYILLHQKTPRAVAEYYDLLFEISENTPVESGKHGALIRQVGFDTPGIEDLIKRAHDSGEWVVNFDSVSSRTLLKKNDINIIRDISVPNTNSRVIISARNIDLNLKRKIVENLAELFGSEVGGCETFSNQILKDTIEISGRKVLSAVRISNTSREIMGLSIMRHHLEEAVQLNLGEKIKPIWLSLDDYQGWFNLKNTKFADAVAVYIKQLGNNFQLYLQVGEAKFIKDHGSATVIQDANRQLESTVNQLAQMFIRKDDQKLHEAWCTRFADLLVSREGLVDCISSQDDRNKFLDQLRVGEVDFKITGDAVICIYDKFEPSLDFDHSLQQNYLRQQVLTSPIIKGTLNKVVENESLGYDKLGEIHWFPSQEHLENGSEDKSTQDANEASENRNENFLDENQHDTNDPKSEKPSDETISAVVENSINGKGHGSETDEVDSQSDTSSIMERPAVMPEPVFKLLQKIVATEVDNTRSAESIQWAEGIAKETQRALSGFGMVAEFANTEPKLTPNGALITFKGNAKLTLDQITRRQTELLTTHGIDVADIRPGLGTITLFIKRLKRATVPLASTWIHADWPPNKEGEVYNYIIGEREDEDRMLYLNLDSKHGGYETHAPHTLIAGETGSGKGVLTQGLLLQIAMLNSPSKTELIVIDPKKGVDYTWIKEAPQLRNDIVTEPEGAKEVFNKLVMEMNHRYDLFQAKGVPNIVEYNSKVESEKQLPRIILVHDEMGAWMVQEKEYREVVLSSVSHLGMKARAAGIHLILITQRADAEAVPTQLRDNMGNRLCLKVQNSTGSRMVLNCVGAEKLLGKGHLACILANEYLPAGQNFYTVQVPFADTSTLNKVAEEVIKYWRMS